MYSVKETARKIICPTESDEMNVKRIVRYLKGAPSAKSLIEICNNPEVRERLHRQQLGRSTNDTQKYKWRSCAVVKRNSHSMVTNTAYGELEFCRGRIICSDNWNCRRNGDKTTLARTRT